MRRYTLLLILSLAIISACGTTTEPGDDPALTGDITVEQVTGLPTVGGNVTGIALEPSGRVIALIDGALYTIASSSDAPQRMGTGNDYKAFGLAP
ncbi:MAG: hypothetical protein H7X80_01745, partial [bacterium]|nr:hypothetical protein [Candidatus Kapabacteria bacterium]